MATRNQNIRSLSVLSAVLVAVVLFLLNAAAARTNIRVDMTEEGLYTLSDSSVAVLRSLEDDATIRVFWHNVPEVLEPERRYVESMLREMRSASGGKVTLRWVDLEDDAGKTEADEAGVQRSSFHESREGEQRLREAWNSLAIKVGPKSETVDGLAGIRTRLEYAVVSSLFKMTRVDDVVVGLIASRPQMNPYMGAQGGRFNALEAQLAEVYGAGFRRSIDLSQPIAPDVDVLLLAAPENLEEEQIYHLEQYILRGGRALLLIDPVHSPLGRAPGPRPTSSGLEEWLAALGVSLEPGVVGDLQAMQQRPRVTMTQIGRVEEWVNYPYWPVVIRQFMDKENPAMRGFAQIPLHWPVAISVDPLLQERAGRKATVLAATTDAGWRRDDLTGLDRAEEDPFSEEGMEAEIPLMVLLEGPMDSFWRAPVLPWDDAPEEDASEEEPGEAEPGEAEPGEADAPDESAPADGEGSADEEADPEGEPSEPPVDEPVDEPADEPADEDGDEPAGEPDEQPAGEPAAEPADPPAEEPSSEEPSAEGGPADGAPASEAAEEGPKRLTSGEGLLILLTDAEFVDDDVSRVSRGSGFGVVLNLLDWMGGSEELLALRAKTANPRTFDPVEPRDQDLTLWLNLALVPLLVLFAGIVVFIVRRYQR